MKEMEYVNSLEPISEVLAAGTCMSIPFYVVSYGNHPCCYIELSAGHPLFGVDYDELPDPVGYIPHGGFTYSEPYLKAINSSEGAGKWYLGWDYGHIGDFCAYMLMPHWQSDPEAEHAKKWTINELVEECIDVIKKIDAALAAEGGNA